MNLLQTDFGRPHRRQLISRDFYLEEQRKIAIQRMGPRWLLHPDNHVQRQSPSDTEPKPAAIRKENQPYDTPILLKRQAC